MAITCARCGTQNPDLNQFCEACGSPLAVAAAPPGPTSAPPPGPPSGPPPGPPPAPLAAYVNPYYPASAVGPQPMVHRTPWVLIIGAMVGLVLVMAGCGAAIALLGRNSATSTNTTGINLAPVPSPTPAGPPQPNQTPSSSPSPSPASTSGATASNAGESLTVPAGWVVTSKDAETITLTNPTGDGSVTVGSGPSSPRQTAQQNKDTVDKFFAGQYPDTKNCPNSKTTTSTLSGAPGIFWELCFTLTSGGHSIQAGAPVFAGANSDGSVYYLVIMMTAYANMDSFITEATPILQSIQWKLK